MPTYPAQIDNANSLPQAVDNFTPVSALVFNPLRSAVLSIESTLGINPQGLYGTVAQRLNALEGIANMPFIQISQDIGGTPNSPLIIGIQGRPVSDATPTFGQILAWDGIAWVPTSSPANITFSGDLTGTPTNQTVVGLRTFPIANVSPTSGQALIFNGTEWAPAPASGFTAGGDLSGNATSQTVIGIQGIPISATPPTTGQVLQYNGSNWAPVTSTGGNVLVYQQGGTASGNVYTSWTALMAARAAISGPAIIAVDDTYTKPSTVDVGTWNLGNNTSIVGNKGGIYATEAYNQLQIPSGATLNDPSSLSNIVILGDSNTTSCFKTSALPFFSIDCFNVLFSNSGSAPILDVTGSSGGWINFNGGCSFESGNCLGGSFSAGLVLQLNDYTDIGSDTINVSGGDIEVFINGINSVCSNVQGGSAAFIFYSGNLSDSFQSASIGTVLTKTANNAATWEAAGGVTIENQGTGIANNPHGTINFVGAGVVAADNSGIAQITISGSPVGSAGGDLSGTYPNPTVVGIHGISVPSPTGTNTFLEWTGSAFTWGSGGGGGGGYATIEEFGNALTQQTTLNFASGAYAVNNSNSSRTDVTVDPTDNGIAYRNAARRWIRRNNPSHSLAQFAPVSNVTGTPVYDPTAGWTGAGIAMGSIGDWVFYMASASGSNVYGLYGIDTYANAACNGGAAITTIGSAQAAQAQYPWDMVCIRTNIDASPYNGAQVDLIFTVSQGYANLGYVTNNGTYSMSATGGETVTYTQIYSQTSSLPSSGTAFGANAVCLGNPPLEGSTNVPYFAIVGRDAHCYILGPTGSVVATVGSNVYGLCVDDDGFLWTSSGTTSISATKYAVSYGTTNLTSGNQNMASITTLSVASTTGFPTSGTAYVQTSSGYQSFNYTGTNGTQFTGVNSGGGTTLWNGNVYTTSPIITLTAIYTGSLLTGSANIPYQLVPDGRYIWGISAGNNESGLTIYQWDRVNAQPIGQWQPIPLNGGQNDGYQPNGSYIGRAAWDGELLWVPDACWETSGGGEPQFFFMYAINPRSREVVYASPGIVGAGALNPNTAIMYPRGITITDAGQVYVSAILNSQTTSGYGLNIYSFARESVGAHLRSLALDTPLLPVYGGAGWINGFDVDFTKQGNVTLSTAGNYTFSGAQGNPGGTMTLINPTPGSNPASTLSSSGWVISPSNSNPGTNNGAYSNHTYTALQIALTSIYANATPATPLRIWLYVSSESQSPNGNSGQGEGEWIAIDDWNGSEYLWSWSANRGFGGSGNGYYITMTSPTVGGSSGSSTADFVAAPNVFCLYLPDGTGGRRAYLYRHDGSFVSGNWPSFASMVPFCYGDLTSQGFNAATYTNYRGPSQQLITFGVSGDPGFNGGDGFTATIGRIKIEYMNGM